MNTIKRIRYRKVRARNGRRLAEISGSIANNSKSPTGATSSQGPEGMIALAIRQALNPKYAPAPVKSLADMTPEEQAEMRRLYERGPKCRS